MADFVFIYRNTPELQEKYMNGSEAAEEKLKKSREWFNDLAAKGHLKDIGIPLHWTGKVVAGSKKAVTDGPYAETKDLIGGVTVIVAKDLAEAAELAKGCPILERGGSVEVRPAMALPEQFEQQSAIGGRHGKN